MKVLLATAAAIGLAVSAPAHAQQPLAPGQLQGQGSAKGSAGAATNAPGHLMQNQGSAQGTVGASGYAPGRAGADADVNTNANVKAGGAAVGTGVKANGKVNTR